MSLLLLLGGRGRGGFENQTTLSLLQIQVSTNNPVCSASVFI